MITNTVSFDWFQDKFTHWTTTGSILRAVMIQSNMSYTGQCRVFPGRINSHMLMTKSSLQVGDYQLWSDLERYHYFYFDQDTLCMDEYLQGYMEGAGQVFSCAATLKTHLVMVLGLLCYDDNNQHKKNQRSNYFMFNKKKIQETGNQILECIN